MGAKIISTSKKGLKMMEISFIDLDLKDFIRDSEGKPIIVKVSDPDEAVNWLLKNGPLHGWQMNGTRYFDWKGASMLSQK